MEQLPLPGVQAPAGSVVTVSVRVSRVWAWVIAGVGTLLAAGAAVGAARWWSSKSVHGATVPAFRVTGSADAGHQAVPSEGSPVMGPAIRLRCRADLGSQTVDADARILAEERRLDG